MTSFRYRLLAEDGSDLGPLASRRPEWSEGDTLARWHGEKLVVVRTIDAEPHDVFRAYVVVRPKA
ncbi:MAG: hypothetical protein QOH23_2278 [Gaiellaceae bacterium]|nr:hypothetical protein [Gaiellaceae bacterium]